MSKYADRLKRSKDQISADTVSSAEKTAIFAIKKVILTQEERLSTLEAAKEAALGSNPFDINRVIALGKESAEAEATKDVAEKLLKEEFAN